jgi:hypothetical protein
MAFHIKKPETDALARKVAALKKSALPKQCTRHSLMSSQASRVSCLWSNSASSFAGICAPGAIRTGRSPPTWRSATVCMRTPDVH